MLSPKNPIRIVLGGRPPALKNNRKTVIKKDRIFSIPNTKAGLYLQHARTDIVRQLPPGFSVLETAAAVVVFLHLYFVKSFPSWDADNIYTMLQEALQGIVLHNDRQVQVFHCFLLRTFSKQSEWVEVFVFERSGESWEQDRQDMEGFYAYYRNIEKGEADRPADRGFASAEPLW